MASKNDTRTDQTVRDFNSWKQNNPGLDFLTQNITVNTFVTGCKDGNYNLNPLHQRNVVHNNKWQSDIITSVMRGYPLGCPEFDTCCYIEGDNVGLDYFRSLDGKQRLSSIFRFLDNKYNYDGNIKLLKGKKFKKWPKIWQNHLKRSSISIAITKQTLSDEEVTDYFNKKQNTKKTSGGETFNAVLTIRSTICKNICDNAQFPQKSRESNKRHKLLEIIVRLCYVQYAISNNMLNIDPNILTLVEFLNSEKDNDAIIFQRYTNRINFIINIVASFNEKMKETWAKTSLIPLMYLLCKKASLCEIVESFIKTKIEGNNNFYPEKVAGNHNASVKRCEFIIEEFNKFNNAEEEPITY